MINPDTNELKRSIFEKVIKSGHVASANAAREIKYVLRSCRPIDVAANTMMSKVNVTCRALVFPLNSDKATSAAPIKYDGVIQIMPGNGGPKVANGTKKPRAK